MRAKMAKLKEQKRVADEINELLTRPGEDGLNECSRKTMKNLEVAVVVSKRPGFFEYYKVRARQIAVCCPLLYCCCRCCRCEPTSARLPCLVARLLASAFAGGGGDPKEWRHPTPNQEAEPAWWRTRTARCGVAEY